MHGWNTQLNSTGSIYFDKIGVRVSARAITKKNLVRAIVAGDLFLSVRYSSFFFLSSSFFFFLLSSSLTQNCALKSNFL